MTRTTCLLSLLLAISAPAESRAGDWTLAWSDEFEIAGRPDPDKWQYEHGFVRNKELQYYTRDRHENARVEDGQLIIEARKESWPNPKFKANSRKWQQTRQIAQYTSASLTTEGKANWTYGRIEVRAKMPRGRGVWPAIWALGMTGRHGGWPACGEIDILEFVGHEPSRIFSNVHCQKYNHLRGNGKGHSLAIEGPSDSFHTYALNWHPERLDFFVDDSMHFTYPNEGSGPDAWPFDQPHYLILNLAIGGTWGAKKGVDESIFPQRYEIDYVRVYKRK